MRTRTAYDTPAPRPARGHRSAPPPPATRLLLTVEEAAEVLCVGRSLMYELISTGAVASVQVGRLRRVRPEALTDYVATLG
jgi:excisionase family DNA binding protein